MVTHSQQLIGAARRDQRGLVPVPSYQEIGRAPDVGVTDHVMVS